MIVDRQLNWRKHIDRKKCLGLLYVRNLNFQDRILLITLKWMLLYMTEGRLVATVGDDFRSPLSQQQEVANNVDHD